MTIPDKIVKEFNNAKFFSMEKFIQANKIEMAEKEDKTLLLSCGERKIMVSWSSPNRPQLWEILEYLLFSAHSVHSTRGMDTWLDTYSEILTEPVESVDGCEVMYRDCIDDFLRLKFLLGDKLFTHILEHAHSHRSLH